jgi:hypothetical protein
LATLAWIVILGGISVFGQQSGNLSLEDLVGKWQIDFEKSYSRSERKSVSGYAVDIALSDVKLRLYWDYTISGNRSRFSEDLIVDGKEHGLDHINEWDAWSYKASLKKNELKKSFSYRTTRQNVGAVLDYQTYSLSADKKYLIVESVFRSAGRFDQFNSQTKKLVFSRVD